MKLTISTSIILLICLFHSYAQNHTVIIGRVLEANSNKAIPSATVRITGSNKGTIANAEGVFRLPKGNFTNKHSIKISAVGYYTITEDIDLTNDSATFHLKINPVVMKQAVVTANINVNEIIRRAIAQKNTNKAKYNTMICQIYSKTMIDMAQTANDLYRDIGKDTLQAQFGQGAIVENFATRYIDNDKNIDYRQITKRRQTANQSKSMNTHIIDDFVDFSKETVDILDARIITPLNNNALSHYKFELIERKMFDTSYIYVIKVIPNTAVFPTFEGHISILEGTYQIIEADLKPSKDTKIWVIDDLHFVEKFEFVQDNIWLPTYCEINGKFYLKLIPFIPAIQMEFNGKSIISNISVNVPLPDSLYTMSDTTRTDVAKDADSTTTNYWEDNALLELSEREKQMYQEIDTAAKELKIDVNDSNIVKKVKEYKAKQWNFNWIPDGWHNRVEGYTIGINTITSYRGFALSLCPQYDFGLKKEFGSAKLTYSNRKTDALSELLKFLPISTNKWTYSIYGRIFSNVSPFANVFKTPALSTNTFTTLFLNNDYYDYYRKDGWSIGGDINYKSLTISADYEEHRITGLDKTSDKCWIKRKTFRENPQPQIGSFALFKTSASMGEISSLFEITQFALNANYSIGYDRHNYYTFAQAKGAFEVQFPIFETGYGNALLYLAVAGGIAAKNTPVQYQIAIDETSIFSNIFTPSNVTFITAFETYLGGTSYYSYHLRLNLRDWWWRFLHLPRIKGRGIELSVIGASGKFFNASDNPLYRTSDGYYTEAGVRLGRIPIPGTDLFYFSIEGRMGIGTAAKGNWGFIFDFQLPFSSFNGKVEI
ncbi:MAG: DUF5686 and carboxypeptidase regulatory-like domain-containing protein [Ignavibacteria bacterium]|nr:DUF5686 and carboxypeptidase regulatory-like domain-containing protein [Ignavibacteria bacterium]